MTNHIPLKGLILLVMVSATGTCATAAELHYAWRDGDTLAYKFTITATALEDSLAWNGNCTFSVTGAPPDAAALAEAGIATGTGFVVNADGYLATCAHVVKGARKIDVNLNGKSYIAQVKAVDPDHDVAIVRIAAKDLPVLPLLDSSKVELNEDVLVVGFPLANAIGASIKMSRGILAGIIDEKGEKLFQTDAAMNHGNSGGPVVNERGQVIGVASAKIEKVEVSNVGFIEPAMYVANLLKGLNIDFKGAEGGETLKGAALGRLVSPSVAFFTVSIGPERTRVERKAFNYSGVAKSVTKNKANAVIDEGPQMTDTGRLVANLQGQISESTSEHELPFCLGKICELFVEPLTLDGGSKWKWVRQTSINQVVSNSAQGYAGVRGRAGGNAQVIVHPAVESASYEIVDTAGDLLTIKKQYEFATMPKPGQAPFLSISGEATFVFNQRAGVIENMDFDFGYDYTTKGTRRHLPVKVSFERVEPKTFKPLLGNKGLASSSSSAGGRIKPTLPAGNLLPLPEKAAREEALTLVNDLFKKDLEASKSAAKKLELARKLIASSREEKDDAAARFVLLDKARQMAIAAHDLDVSLEAVQELAAHYQVDSFGMQADVLTSLNDPEAAPEKQKTLAEAAFVAFEVALAADEFDAAKRLGSVAITAARKGRDGKLTKRIADGAKQFKGMQEAFAPVRSALDALKNAPDDPQANMIVGRYRCFFKDNWADGLSMLAKGSDPALRALAEKELAAPSVPTEQLAIADGWYEQAEKQPEAKDRLLAHASGWYERALPNLSGLQRMKIEKRIVRPDGDPSVEDSSSKTAASKPPSAKSPTAKTGSTETSARTPAAAAGAAKQQLLQHVKELLKNKQLSKTKEVGFTLGNDFDGVPEIGGILIGFDLSHNGATFVAVRPIFATEKGTFEAPVYGTPNANVLRVLAKKGYAVGGIRGRGGLGIDGMAITFMEIQPGGLNREKAYESDWIGGDGGGEVIDLGGSGAPVMGMFGHMRGSAIVGLGLVIGESK